VIAPILIASTPSASTPSAATAAAVFAVATIALFGVSASYHRFPWRGRWLTVVRRLDHSMIFVAIAATYTPMAMALPPAERRLILWVAWVGAVVGVVTQMAWPTAPRPLMAGLYVVVGWAALLVVDDLWRALGVGGFVLLLVGGALHTMGAAVYAGKWPNPWPRWFGFHEIFHALVIAAVAIHYVVVAFFALPAAA
jgi:hemolysin III